MEQESPVLRRSLLSIKKEPFPYVIPTLIIAYKYYILTFDQNRNQGRGDCVVFDTEKGACAFVNSGLNIPERAGFSSCHWKDNIFVLYGGEFYGLPGQGHYIRRKEAHDPSVHFLSVIENDGQISFTVESCNFTDKQWWDYGHSAHIFQDNMYIFGCNPKSSYEILKKFNLNERTWRQCRTTGDIPRPCAISTTVQLDSKIYFFGSSRNARDPFGGQAGEVGPFGAIVGGVAVRGREPESQPQDLFVLDLENMQWQKVRIDDFLPREGVKTLFHAERVGDKIALSHNQFNEFFIYDPANNKLSKSEGFPPNHHWRIRSFENQSFIFRMYPITDKEAYIEYQNLAAETQPKQQDPLIATTQQLPHMQYIWKEKPFADVTFIVQNEEISAHRVILLKCRYFQNMFKSGMIEATSQKINVPDISPTNFKAILEYIYCDKIELTEQLAMELIILADMYFLPNLKADCEKYLSEKLTTANFVQVMKVAQTADSEQLEKRVVSFLTSNIAKVKEEVDIQMIPPELFIKAIMDLKPTKK